MYSREELKELKRVFWNSFSDYCRTQPRLRSRTTMFMLYSTRLRGVEMKFDVGRNLTAVILEFNDRNEERRMRRYNHFLSYRVIFNHYFENDALVFEPQCLLCPQKTVSRISVARYDLNYLNQSHWPEIFSFMAKNMLRMEDAFKEIRATVDD